MLKDYTDKTHGNVNQFYIFIINYINFDRSALLPELIFSNQQKYNVTKSYISKRAFQSAKQTNGL